MGLSNLNRMRMNKSVLVIFFLLTMKASSGYSQDVILKIGIRDSIQSTILMEKRQIIINLPKDYNTSESTYPVLYVLDGLESNILDAINITYRLGVKMIIVAIPNTNRSRDMMPLSTPSYQVDNPGAEYFLQFLEDELIPYVESKYRSNGHRTIRGRSLSGLFVLYAFLEKPQLFEYYIGTSAGWYSDMSTFFDALIERALTKKEQFEGKALFIANSIADPYDPNQEVHNAIIAFSEKLEMKLGDSIRFKYETYDKYGHVPYPSFYDGLNYVLRINER